MSPLRVLTERGGEVVRLVLDRPKANVLDAELIAALSGAVRGLKAEGPLKLVVIEGAGPHFSFGASVVTAQVFGTGQLSASLRPRYFRAW